jgi:GcrA cell cycle regulator
VCAKLLRIGLKRGHKLPTAKPKTRAGAEAKAGVVGCLRPPGGEDVSRKTVVRQPKEFTKRQLYAMLAEAVRNTG